jgi:hypothetical protein
MREAYRAPARFARGLQRRDDHDGANAATCCSPDRFTTAASHLRARRPDSDLPDPSQRVPNVICRIDRLSRLPMEFSKLVEVFDRNGGTLVFVTHSFNTAALMARL